MIDLLLYRLKECVRMVRIKQLVRSQKGDKILGVAEIDYAMRPAGDHVNSYNLLIADLKADLFVRMDIVLLNQRATADDDEELPL